MKKPDGMIWAWASNELVIRREVGGDLVEIEYTEETDWHTMTKTGKI